MKLIFSIKSLSELGRNFRAIFLADVLSLLFRPFYCCTCEIPWHQSTRNSIKKGLSLGSDVGKWIVAEPWYSKLNKGNLPPFCYGAGTGLGWPRNMVSHRLEIRIALFLSWRTILCCCIVVVVTKSLYWLDLSYRARPRLLLMLFELQYAKTRRNSIHKSLYCLLFFTNNWEPLISQLK